MRKKKIEEQEVENLEEFDLDKNCEDEHCDCEECGCECEDCLHENDEEACECEECEKEACGCGECHCHENNSKAEEYLAMAQRLQADFENYRKRVAEQLDYQKQEGIKSVIEVFLPCLDTFKEAKKNISDEGVLSGINMIEDKIVSALQSVGAERIESVGQKFDPHKHNVIALLNNENYEDDIILEEYQAGWTLNGKVIRYSKVIVNKKQ